MHIKCLLPDILASINDNISINPFLVFQTRRGSIFFFDAMKMFFFFAQENELNAFEKKKNY